MGIFRVVMQDLDHQPWCKPLFSARVSSLEPQLGAEPPTKDTIYTP